MSELNEHPRDERKDRSSPADSDARSRKSSEVVEDPFNDTHAAPSVPSRSPSSNAADRQTEDQQKETPSSEVTTPPLPSHSPLAFANYPPVWINGPRPRANPQAGPSSSSTSRRGQSGFSAATLSSVMSSGSKDDKARKFAEKDPSNRHQYLQSADEPYSRPRLNIFGRDIGGLGKPPSMRFRRQKGK